MDSEKIYFPNQQGVELAGRLELPPDRHPRAYALLAHCFTCSKNLSVVRNISRALTEHGFGILRFDFTGLGESEGDFIDTNFSSNIQDLVDAAHFMKEKWQAPKLIIGHSLGGAAALFAGSKISSIQAIATIGAPSSPQHLEHLFKHKLKEITSSGTAMVQIAGRTFPISAQLIRDISATNMEETLKNLRKPLLILHSPQDKVVDIKNAAEIYTLAKHPKSFISLDGADHLLSEKKDSIYAGKVIAQWAERYVEMESRDLPSTNQQVVARISDEGYTTEIVASGHALVADEPEEVGGNNFGPSPYDLLLSSLGACTAMTLCMYADRKKWDLDEVKVHLSHSKNYIEDCEQCEDKAAKIDHIKRTVELSGNLDEKQKERLIEIAEKCPVHKTLHSPIHVQTTLQS